MISFEKSSNMAKKWRKSFCNELSHKSISPWNMLNPKTGIWKPNPSLDSNVILPISTSMVKVTDYYKLKNFKTIWTWIYNNETIYLYLILFTLSLYKYLKILRDFSMKINRRKPKDLKRILKLKSWCFGFISKKIKHDGSKQGGGDRVTGGCV